MPVHPSLSCIAGASSAKFSGAERKSFTLVELLVVVSIIALLIAILLPSLKKAREQARTVKCLANLRSMGSGIHLYATDHNSRIPGPLHPPIYRNTGGSASGTSGWPAMSNNDKPWFLLYRLAPYFTKYDTYMEYTDAVATCPTYAQKNPDENYRRDIDAHHYPTTDGGGNNPSWSRPFHYLPNSWANTAPVFYFGWVNTGASWEGFSNGLNPNERPFSLNPPSLPAPLNPAYYSPKPLEIIKRTSDEWALGDAVYLGSRRPPAAPNQTQWIALGTWQLLNGAAATGDSQRPLLRKPIHLGDVGTNLVFFDSHAETFKGTTAWGTKFPANLRSPLKRLP